MKARFYCITLVLAACLPPLAPRLLAQDGLQGALPRVMLASPLKIAAPFGPLLAVADFDNDHKPDAALLVQSGLTMAGESRFRIELHLSAAVDTSLAFESAETGLALAVLDVNEDGAADLVVEQSLTHKRLYVWLGDGHGGFHRGRIEDFLLTGNTSNQFGSPQLLQNSPALCSPPQRAGESAELAVLLLADLPPPARGVAAFLGSSSLISPLLSPGASRAPPSVL
jgi:hypothetical protein